MQGSLTAWACIFYLIFDNITLSKVVSHQRAIAFMPAHGLQCGVMLTVNESFIPKIQLDSMCSIEFEYMLFHSWSAKTGLNMAL